MPGYEDTLAPARYHGNLITMETRMTKAEMVAEMARLRAALYQAHLDISTAAERTETEGTHWTRGYLEQAAQAVRDAVGVAR